MKRIAVLLVVLLAGLSLYGCGANGTTGTTSSSSGNNGSTSNPNGTPSGPVTAFTIKLVDNSELVSRGVNTGHGGTITNARVVIRQIKETYSTIQVCSGYIDLGNGELQCNGIYTNQTVTAQSQVWKDIQDVAYGSQITVNIPQGDGYTLDVIGNLTSGTTSSINIMSYGTTSNVTVPSSNTTITMTSVPDILKMSVNDPVPALGTLVVSLSNGKPFNSTYQLVTHFNDIVDNSDPNNLVTLGTTTTPTSSKVNNIKMPSSTTANKQIDVSAVFTLNSEFVKSTDTPGKWTRTFPDIAYGEAAFSIFHQFIPITIGL